MGVLLLTMTNCAKHSLSVGDPTSSLMRLLRTQLLWKHKFPKSSKTGPELLGTFLGKLALPRRKNQAESMRARLTEMRHRAIFGKVLGDEGKCQWVKEEFELQRSLKTPRTHRKLRGWIPRFVKT